MDCLKFILTTTGQLKEIGVYNNGLPYGEWKFYFENGKLFSEEIKIIHLRIRNVVTSKLKIDMISMVTNKCQMVMVILNVSMMMV